MIIRLAYQTGAGVARRVERVRWISYSDVDNCLMIYLELGGGILDSFRVTMKDIIALEVTE